MASEVTIRELRASDRRAVAFAFGHLSEQSRYQRFLTAKPELTPRELRSLLDVDHWHHEALIAFSPPPRAPIGIARYVRLQDDFEAAEVAIAITDEWQRHGVGTSLLAALTERAVRAGIRRFQVAMLRENRAARALVGKLAPRIQPATVMAAAGNMVELSYSLSVESSAPAGSSGPASSPPSPPTATGVGAGAGSITVSLTSASEAGTAPSSPAGQSTTTVDPDATCERRTKSASGSST